MTENSNLTRYFKRIASKDFLPKTIHIFLEAALTGAQPNKTPHTETQIPHTCDTVAHTSGKSLLQRHELYPYATLESAQAYLHSLTQTVFPEHMTTQPFVVHMHQVGSALNAQKDLAESLLAAFLHEDESFYQKQAEISAEFSFMCYFMAYFTFLPFFIHTRRCLQNTVPYDTHVWPHGHCPYCGSPALLSYLKEKEGKRMHACSLCLGIYRAPRIQCPYCLEEKQDMFNYFTSDTDPDCHVCICKKCATYIKIVDARELEIFAPHPLLDDFATLTLDVLAMQQQAEKGNLSLWLQ